TGLEHVPRSGALLVACNHVSLVDPPLLASTIASARRPRFLGKKELFEIPLLGWFFRALGAIPLDRGGADIGAMREALATLEKGGALAIFPEGTRVRPGQSRPPKTGVSFLSARSGAPVLPVRVLGTADFPWGRPLEIRFGAPLPAAKDEGREAASAYARAVMEAVNTL
ncbi:MAG: hypothetical protein A2506_12325, partial [Elusimicrobia bacterium RIFOXYD12_FULL_66_9]